MDLFKRHTTFGERIINDSNYMSELYSMEEQEPAKVNEGALSGLNFDDFNHQEQVIMLFKKIISKKLLMTLRGEKYYEDSRAVNYFDDFDTGINMGKQNAFLMKNVTEKQ